jgi:hypothetical protein
MCRFGRDVFSLAAGSFFGRFAVRRRSGGDDRNDGASGARMDIGRQDREFSDARPLSEDRGAADFSGGPRRLLDQALSWIVRLKSGEATQADLVALRRWRDESPRHEEAFRDAARLWRRIRTAAQELAEEARTEKAAALRQGAGQRWSWRGALISFAHRPRR